MKRWMGILLLLLLLLLSARGSACATALGLELLETSFADLAAC